MTIRHTAGIVCYSLQFHLSLQCLHVHLYSHILITDIIFIPPPTTDSNPAFRDVRHDDRHTLSFLLSDRASFDSLRYLHANGYVRAYMFGCGFINHPYDIYPLHFRLLSTPAFDCSPWRLLVYGIIYVKPYIEITIGCIFAMFLIVYASKAVELVLAIALTGSYDNLNPR